MKIDNLIIGSGMAGLGVAIELNKKGKQTLILEALNKVGGLNTSMVVRGCNFDIGPKILLLDDSKNSKEILNYLDGNYEKYPVIEKVYISKYGLVGFPLQRHLVDLPYEARQKMLRSFRKAQESPKKVKSFKDWLYNGFGKKFCNEVLYPYEEKKWQVDLTEMDYAWALERPIKIDTEVVEAGAVERLPPQRYYYYPKHGNIETLTRNMSKDAGAIVLNSRVEYINTKKKYARDSNGNTYHYNKLISTAPLDSFVKMCDIKSLKKEPGLLRRVSISVYNFVFRGDHNLDGTAIYFPEKKFIFRRVCVSKNLCPALASPGYTTLSIEISNTKNYYNRILKDFGKIEQFRKLGKPIDWKMIQVDFAYPLQLNGLKDVVKKIHEKFEKINIYHCGRGGNYDYCNSDRAYEQGKRIARRILI